MKNIKLSLAFILLSLFVYSAESAQKMEPGFINICAPWDGTDYRGYIFSDNAPLLIFDIYTTPINNKYYLGPDSKNGGSKVILCENNICSKEVYESKIMINKFTPDQMSGFIEYKIDKGDRSYQSKAFTLNPIKSDRKMVCR